MLGTDTTLDSVAPPTAREVEVAASLSAGRQRVLLGVYTAAVFVSAFLLFLVQPMFSKMVLPMLGGTPAVWNTCMLFFQAALLGGYLYAHLGPRWLGVRRHSAIHLALLAAAFLALPIALPGTAPTTDEAPVLWLLGALALSLGLPFFAVSASGPLLQKWFSETGHRDAHNPYFLYAASNAGSLLALLSYPALVEPRLRLADQSLWWTGGYVTLFALFCACALLLRLAPAPAGALAAGGVTGGFDTASAASPVATHAEAAAPTLRDRAAWVLYSLVPSSLLLGVTAYLTTDVAAVPLLWIVPLALYLLTFIFVFARRQVLPHGLLVNLAPFLAVPILLGISLGATGPGNILYPLHLLGFFVLAMVCHGELARRKPDAAHLTEFYLWMSVGGVLGGVFNVLIAPRAFDSLFEYPLAIAAACALRPSPIAGRGLSRLMRSVVVVLGLLMAASLTLTIVRNGFFAIPRLLVLLIGIGTVALANYRRWFTSGAALYLIVIYANATWINAPLYVERTFFGVHRVTIDDTGQYHQYGHGTTLHGVQSLDPALRTTPLSYFSFGGPVGQLLSGLERTDTPQRVAVVGLGTGAMACHGRPGDEWTFYEIDPAVERIARDPRYFTYLRDCPPRTEVVLGDARLTLANAPDGAYDVIFLDAFTSDAIPIHLLTREALALYLTKLANGGVVMFHISNRHLDLEPMVARLAQDAGLIALVARNEPSEEDAERNIFPSVWIAMARDREALGAIARSPEWTEARLDPDVALWTDDFSNILSVFRW